MEQEQPSEEVAEAFLVALRVAAAEACRAHPAFRVDDEDFFRHLSGLVSSPTALGTLIAEDVVVAFAAARRDKAGSAAFEELLQTGARQGLTRLRLDDSRRDEVVQRVRIRCTVGSDNGGPKLLTYSGRGPLLAWVRVALVHAAYNLMAEPGERAKDAWDTDALAEVVGNDSVEGVALVHVYGEAVRSAVAAAIGDLVGRDRALLRFFLVEELTVDEIGVIYGVHRATAARWVAKARETLADGVREHFRRSAATTDSEFYSVVQGLPSWLDCSVERLLRESANQDSPQLKTSPPEAQ